MSDPIEELRKLDEKFAPRINAIQSSSRIDDINELRAAYDALRAELEKVKGDRKDDQEYIESLCKDLCAMEDALGFKNDCHDKDGALVPTIGPWLERVRDLVAAEGELGDLKEALDSERAANAGLREDNEKHADQIVRQQEEIEGLTNRLREAGVLLSDVRCYEGTIVTEDIPFFEWCRRRDAILTTPTTETKP